MGFDGGDMQHQAVAFDDAHRALGQAGVAAAHLRQAAQIGGGVVAFVAGALMLIDTELPGYGVPPGLVAGLALASLLLVTGTVRLAMNTRRRPVTSGAAAFAGAEARVEELGAGGLEAWVRFEGELWQAAATRPLRRGQAVRVLERDGLVLRVVAIAPIEPIAPQPGASP